VPPRQVESSLKMHPYAAKQLVGRLRDANLDDLRAATETLADLELWCRGGADYGDELALTLALRLLPLHRHLFPSSQLHPYSLRPYQSHQSQLPNQSHRHQLTQLRQQTQTCQHRHHCPTLNLHQYQHLPSQLLTRKPLLLR
jgi:hypothetical protein